MKNIKLKILLVVILTTIFYGIYNKPEIKKDEGFAQILMIENGKTECIKGYCPSTKLSETCFNLSPNKKVNQLFEEYFKDCNVRKHMYAFGQAESGGKAVKHNRGLNRDGSIDFGFMQINSIHKPKNESLKDFENRMYNLEENIKMAQKIYEMQGFRAWSTFNNKKYLAYLK
jgi:hypothetical protein